MESQILNIEDLKSIQKIASQAMKLIDKYAPEPEDEEDWESDEDSDIEDDEYEDE